MLSHLFYIEPVADASLTFRRAESKFVSKGKR